MFNRVILYLNKISNNSTHSIICVFAEEKRLSSKLAKDVVTESILQAENKLSDIISQDKALQERLIEESLQELDKVKIWTNTYQK